MLDSKIWKGVESLLDSYAKVNPEDKVVLAYTSDSYESAIWVCAALELRNIPVDRVWMAPIKDDSFVDRFISTLPSPKDITGRLLILTFERDTKSHTLDIATALSKYEKHQYAVFRAISASPSLFTDAMQALPEELSARNATILSRCVSAKYLHIKTKAGTDIKVTLDSKKHRWISNRGTTRPGGMTILPSGEVATFPASVSGIYVADFAFNVNTITSRDVRLHNHPVTIWIEEGRAVHYHCNDSLINEFLEECFSTHCSYNVGELGFGTNYGVIDAIPMNSHINERRPGVHLGFGQHNQDSSVVGYQCSIHLDLIARGGLVWIDDDPTPLDLEHIVSSEQPHPNNCRDEDVFSPEALDPNREDCCGILTNNCLLSLKSP